MRGLIFFLILSISGCGIFDNAEESPRPEYDWEELRQFKDKWNSALEITDDDVLYIAQEKDLYVSKDFGTSFSLIETPDSATIVKIRNLDKLYIIGRVYRSSGGVLGSSTNWLYASSDDGKTWQEITGGFLMQDVTYSNGIIYIGVNGGVVSLDLEKGDKKRIQLFNSKMSDAIEEIEATRKGKIVLATHDGLYATTDQGNNWARVSGHISKDDDFIKSIEIDDFDTIFALQNSNLYRVTGDSFEWNTMTIGGGNDQIKLINNKEMVLLKINDLYISSTAEISFEKTLDGSELGESVYIQEVNTFSNGGIIINTFDKIFKGEIK